jgi:hypothetical protein
MDKCKSNIVWKFGPFKIYGDHFYSIAEVRSIIASSIYFPNDFVLIKQCQNCQKTSDLFIEREELEKTIKEFPMAFHPKTLEELKRELSL